MAEEAVVTQESTSQAPTQPVEVPLVQRVSQFKPEAAKTEIKSDENIFDYKEIEAIADPKAKEIALKAYKSMQSGFNKKFEEVAKLRKDLEAKANLAQPKTVWTADKIQNELLSDPTFVAEAQRLAQANPNPSNPTNSGMTNDEWSALNATEKAKFQLMEKEISLLKQQNTSAQQQAAQVHLQQQHESLKTKYANYAPDIVNTTVQNIMQQKTQIGLEDIWKSVDYESAVNRAYELGRQDALGKQRDKLSSQSFDGGMARPATPGIEPTKGESNTSLFQRIARSRLAQAANTPR